jgi:GH25 family lysozyme M1 (1,4-beta-N-acetylmuramidase)
VLIDHGRLSPAAAAQVASYRAGRDGLKGNRPDTFWRPSPIPVYEYPPQEARPLPSPSSPTTPQLPVDASRSPFPPHRNLDGVDTSHHQGGPIDVKAAQAAGLRWWYLKTTEGTTNPDGTYAKRMQQARKAGIPVGSYHFARPDLGDAAQEARYFLAHADIRAGDMLPMLDLESLEGLSRAQVTRWTGTWVATVTAELARKGLVAKPIIYTRFDLGSGFGCLLWVARYSDAFRAPVIPRPWRRAAIWQHSDGRYGPIKSVPGFGPVDVNAVHPDVPLSALRVRSAQRHAQPPAPPAPAPPATPAPQAVPRKPRPSGPVGPDHGPHIGDTAPDLQVLRDELRAAVKNIEAALDSLPER